MHRTRFTLPALALATVGVLLAGCGDDDSGDTAADAPSETSTSDAGAEFNDADVDFAQGMIPHHAQAVEMAQMVPDQGVTPDLVELADAIEGAQQPEIDQMTAMLERWGEDVPSTDMGGHDMEGMETGGMEMEGMMSAEDMDTLAAMTGPEFEQMWLTMMTEHHEGAIAMAEAELADGSDQEAQTLAQGDHRRSTGRNHADGADAPGSGLLIHRGGAGPHARHHPGACLTILKTKDIDEEKNCLVACRRGGGGPDPGRLWQR